MALRQQDREREDEQRGVERQQGDRVSLPAHLRRLAVAEQPEQEHRHGVDAPARPDPAAGRGAAIQPAEGHRGRDRQADRPERMQQRPIHVTTSGSEKVRISRVGSSRIRGTPRRRRSAARSGRSCEAPMFRGGRSRPPGHRTVRRRPARGRAWRATSWSHRPFERRAGRAAVPSRPCDQTSRASGHRRGTTRGGCGTLPRLRVP